MTQSVTKFGRKLCLSAGVLALVTASPALAQTTVLTSSSSNYDLVAQAGVDQYVELSSGTNAYLMIDSTAVPLGGVGVLTSVGDGWKNGIGSTGSSGTALGWWYTRTNAPVIRVDSGATLTVAGSEIYGSSKEYYFYSMFQGNGGEVRFGGGNWTIWGPDTFTNLTLLNNAKLRSGGGYEPWGGCCGAAAATVVNGWLAGASTSILEVNAVNGAGSFTVNGVATAAHAFTGTVNVNGGAVFTVGDSTHASAVFGDPTGKTAHINVTGTLSGYGTIYGNVNNNGIILAGGNSAVNGGLTINGNLTLTDNSILKTSMTPTGVSGLVINGNMVAGGEMDIDVASGSYGNGVYPILVVNGGTITGAFNRVLTTGSTGSVITGLMQTSSGFTIVTEEGSSPQVYGHVLYANRLALTNFVGSLYDAIAMTPASGAKIDTWATVNGGTVNLGRDGLGFDEKSFGLSVGGMHRFERHGGVIGAAFSYRHGNMSVKDDTATAMTNGYDFGLYGGAEVNQVRFDGTVFYSINTAKTDRPMGSFGTSKSSGEGYSYGVSGEISRDVFRGLVAPYVRGMYARMHLAAAAEAGSLQYDLKHDGMNANTFVTDLGLRVRMLRPQEGRRIKVDANFAWRYDLSDPGETASVSFANFASGSNTFFWKGDSKHALVVGLDATGQVTDGLEAYSRLNGMLTSHRRAGELSLGVKYKF